MRDGGTCPDKRAQRSRGGLELPSTEQGGGFRTQVKNSDVTKLVLKISRRGVFSVWPLLLGVVTSRSIYVVTNVKISLFFYGQVIHSYIKIC